MSDHRDLSLTQKEVGGIYILPTSFFTKCREQVCDRDVLKTCKRHHTFRRIWTPAGRSLNSKLALCSTCTASPDDRKPQNWPGVSSEASPSEAHPVQRVNWYDAVAFCNWLSQKEGFLPSYKATGEKELVDEEEFDVWHLDENADGYRLPSEVEWEFACRAGTTSDYSCGNYDPLFRDNERLLKDYVQFSSELTAPCGQKFPNGWGLCDMHGNMAEWCEDRYRGGEAKHIDRGGNYVSGNHVARSFDRSGVLSSARDDIRGFRVARSIRNSP